MKRMAELLSIGCWKRVAFTEGLMIIESDSAKGPVRVQLIFPNCGDSEGFSLALSASYEEARDEINAALVYEMPLGNGKLRA